MNIKQLLKTGGAFLLMTIATSAGASTVYNDSTGKSSTAAGEVRAAVLMNRLHEIKILTKGELNRGEKKQLRKEVIEIKKEMKINNGGIYLSVGAIIIIILLLILIL
jgi:hypothetical protein